jgi:hypothetical protein
VATFVTDPKLTDAVTAANAMQAAPLPGHWDAIVPRANLRAFNKLQGVILNRGFTPDQFADWGDGEDSPGYDWNVRLGVLYAFLEASKGDQDRGAAYREELKEALEELGEYDVVIGGEYVAPDPANARVGFGDVDDSDDRVRLDSADRGDYPSVHDGTRF